MIVRCQKNKPDKPAKVSQVAKAHPPTRKGFTCQLSPMPERLNVDAIIVPETPKDEQGLTLKQKLERIRPRTV